MSSEAVRYVLDTGVVIDVIGQVGGRPPAIEGSVAALSFAELNYGIATARDPSTVEERVSVFVQARSWFDPLPFNTAAADFYGRLSGLVVAAGRQPRPRRLNLMIAAVAGSTGLPLLTSNVDGFVGVESAVEIIEYASLLT